MAAAVLIGAVGLAAGPASAKPGDGEAAKKAIEAKIDERLAQLARLHTQADSAKALTDAHQSTMDGILDAETAGLTRLRAQVDATNDLQTLAGYAKSMVEDYRVYVVVTPQVHLTIAADTVTAVVDRFTTKIEPRLDDAIAKAKAAGKDTTAAEAARATVGEDVTAAANDVNGLAETLLALTPHGYPDNHQTVLDARASIGDARAKLGEARTAAKQVVEALK